jgi:hypothetical protein
VCKRYVWSCLASLEEAVSTAIMAVKELTALFIYITNPLLAIYRLQLTLQVLIGSIAALAAAAAPPPSLPAATLCQVAPACYIVN